MFAPQLKRRFLLKLFNGVVAGLLGHFEAVIIRFFVNRDSFAVWLRLFVRKKFEILFVKLR